VSGQCGSFGGHSLSWRNEKENNTHGTLVAKVWHPEDPTKHGSAENLSTGSSANATSVEGSVGDVSTGRSTTLDESVESPKPPVSSSSAQTDEDDDDDDMLGDDDDDDEDDEDEDEENNYTYKS
jgi:hypothetical protein